jgi:hypothetical protein
MVTQPHLCDSIGVDGYVGKLGIFAEIQRGLERIVPQVDASKQGIAGEVYALQLVVAQIKRDEVRVPTEVYSL